jgi:hypothetical protein
MLNLSPTDGEIMKRNSLVTPVCRAGNTSPFKRLFYTHLELRDNIICLERRGGFYVMTLELMEGCNCCIINRYIADLLDFI